MFATSALDIWAHFFQFDWVGFLCFGLYFLLFVPRQKGEPARTYFGKPRNLVSLALLVAIIGFGLNTLHRAFTH